jgi:hypothetical protein
MKRRNINKSSKRYSSRPEKLVEFEVLTVVVMKSSVFWDIPLCSLLKVNRQGNSLRQARKPT